MELDAVLPVPPAVVSALVAQWEFLAGPGATLTAIERVEVARIARAATASGRIDESSPRARLASTIAVAAHTITADDIDHHVDASSVHEVIEVLGIVARLSAVDTAVRGLGAAPLHLPEPRSGAPTGETDPTAKKRSAFLPTVGAANPVTVLSAIPAEMAHQEALSNAVYLSYHDMMDFDITRDLHRTQMELVAARTSFDNECFY